MTEFGFVLATKDLVDNKKQVGFMYRENGVGEDSGWRFFSGFESQKYVDDPENVQVYSIDTILNIDKSIKPFLTSPAGSAFERDTRTRTLMPIYDFGFGNDIGED